MTQDERLAALVKRIGRLLESVAEQQAMTDDSWRAQWATIQSELADVLSAQDRPQPISEAPADRPEPIKRCEGRYPVPATRPPREEPFPVTYRCALPDGHAGEHGAARPVPTEEK